MHHADTFLFILGDHGIRHGNYSHHAFGTEDANNPAAFLLAPTQMLSLQELHNLIQNQDKLLSPYDIHYSLFVLLQRNSDATCQVRMGMFRGMKLVAITRQVASASRTCAEAGVHAIFCPHHSRPDWEACEATPDLKHRALKQAVADMNWKLDQHTIDAATWDRIKSKQSTEIMKENMAWGKCVRFLEQDFVMESFRCFRSNSSADLEFELRSTNPMHKSPNGEHLRFGVRLLSATLDELRPDPLHLTRKSTIDDKVQSDCGPIVTAIEDDPPYPDGYTIHIVERILELKAICTCYPLWNNGSSDFRQIHL
jgi:hypothetical protein